MRILLNLSLCFLFSPTMAQDSCQINREIDQFTNKLHASIPFFMFDIKYGQIWCTAYRTPRYFSIDFTFKENSDIICFKENSKATVLFIDGSKIDITNIGKLNCKGSFYIAAAIIDNEFITDKENFNLICSKTIKAIRFFTSDGYVDADFKERNGVNPTEFTSHLKCLRNTYK